MFKLWLYILLAYGLGSMFAVNDLLYICFLFYIENGEGGGVSLKKMNKKKLLHWLCLYYSYTPEPWN